MRDPERESESPGTVILPPIRTHGIAARCSERAGGSWRLTTPGGSKGDRGIGRVFTQCVQSCQVFGARLHLPFLHFLQLPHPSPSLRQGAALEEEAFQFLASKPPQNKKNPKASTPSAPPAAAQVRDMPWHLLSASGKRDSSQHPTEALQTSSPFPQPWEESSDLLLSSRKARNLKYDQKKFRDLLFIGEFATQDGQNFSGFSAHLFQGYK